MTDQRPDGDVGRGAFGTRVAWGRVAAVVLVVGMLLAAFTIPIPPFFVFLPGPVRDAEQLIEIGGAPSYSSEGTLYITTVSVDVNVTAADLLSGAIDPSKAVVLKQQLTGNGSLSELTQTERQQMTLSKQHAQEVALTELGYAPPTGDGARVVTTTRGSPAGGVLRPGDVIVGANHHEIGTSCDLGRVIDGLGLGHRVRLRVRRDGALQSLSLSTVPNPDDPSAPVIGVATRDINHSFDPGIKVDFHTGRIVGPSAGLMFTLALYDRLTPGDLTKGRTIAGTGTIECDGGVGPIGGVEEKVAAAERNGAEIFLAPAADFSDARAAADHLRVVEVSNFSSALHYLESSGS